MNMDHLALVVVDMQDSFLRVIEGSEELEKRVAFAVESAKLLGIRVIYTEQVPEKLGITSKLLMDSGLDVSEKVKKGTFSIFGGQGIDEKLEGVNHIIMAGIEGPICIYQSVLGAIQKGMEVTLLSDGIGGRRQDDMRAVTAAFQKMNCQWLPSESVFYSVIGSVEHPRFQRFNSLVKKYA